MERDLNPALEITEACNKKCSACLRPYSAESRQLDQRQLLAYIDDLRALATNHRIRHQFVTGGEPTIWRDANHDIVDVLSALAGLDCVQFVTMPTNGKVFEDLATTRELLTRISARTSGPLIVGLSVAEYQGNLAADHRCRALDHLLRVCGEDQVNIFPVVLVTLAVNDETSALLKEQYPQAYQRVTPLAPLGRAQSTPELCPSLSLAGKDKSSVGTFLPHFRTDVMGKFRMSEAEFDDLPNEQLIDRLSLYNNCGKSPFIDSSWHYCLPLRHDPQFDLAPIGGMQADTIRDFIAARPVLQAIRQRGIITACRERREQLGPETRICLDELLGGERPVSVAYRGCMVCKAFYDAGIIAELMATTSP